MPLPFAVTLLAFLVCVPKADLCATELVRFGEQLPTGVQRIFAGFKHGVGPRGLWQIPPPASVAVAVLDTGADFWQPDFCNNCPLGQPLPVQMDSNLHDGFAAIPTTANSTLWPDPPLTQDDEGHGTHVTGILSARNNGLGIVGVAPGTPIWVVKVLNERATGTIGTVLAGLQWVYDHCLRLDIRVASMSLRGFTPGDDHNCGHTNGDVIHQIVCKLQQRGVLVVAAAGNLGDGIDFAVPAAFSEVLAVTMLADYDGRPGDLQFLPPLYCFSVDPDDSYALFSSSDQSRFDKNRFHIISAPGVCINSTWLTADPHGTGPNEFGSYLTLTGTSQATPHVSASVALSFSGYQCHPVPISPQDMLSKVVADSRRVSVPMTFIPGPYDLASLLSGDMSPFSGNYINAYYGYLPKPLYPFFPTDFSSSPTCPIADI